MSAFAKLWTEEEMQEQAQLPQVPAITPESFEIQVSPALDRLKNHLAVTYASRFDQITAEFKTLGDVDNEGKSKEAVSIISKAKKLGREMEDERGKLTKPLLSFKTGIDNAFKTFSGDLKKVIDGSNAKLSTYQAKVELERRKAEKAAQEEAARIQAQLNEQAKEAGVTAPTVVVPTAAPQPTIIRTDEGTAYQVKKWRCYVVNPDLVPREYCEYSKRLLDNAVDGGIRVIPGCEIKEEIEIRTRRA